ncbi:MAG: hypothetical protein LKF41_04825 [Bifidobacterium sp.]|nr:hypothetical protein [Bifidobacterium sp.]MCH4175166.1 hypothetical protein [Bifidobacterium sp.]
MNSIFPLSDLSFPWSSASDVYASNIHTADVFLSKLALDISVLRKGFVTLVSRSMQSLQLLDLPSSALEALSWVE